MPDLRRLAQCQALLEEGFYVQAAREVQLCKAEDGDGQELLVILAEIYIAQGYINRAKAVLSDAVSTLTGPSQSSTWVIGMMQCVVETVCEGRFAESVSRADEIHCHAATYLRASPTRPNAVSLLILFEVLRS